MGMWQRIINTLTGGMMSTLNELATKVLELQNAQNAEAARQDTKHAALSVALNAVQAELEMLKSVGLTPENQIIVDKAVSDIQSVIAALNAAAV